MNLAKELRRIADLMERSELAPGFAVDVFNLADGTFRYDLRFVLRHPALVATFTATKTETRFLPEEEITLREVIDAIRTALRRTAERLRGGGRPGRGAPGAAA